MSSASRLLQTQSVGRQVTIVLFCCFHTGHFVHASRLYTDAPAFCTNNIDIDARTTLRRTQLVVHVLDLCQTKEFILVKAPPGSGKSALLHLIEVRLEKDGIPVTVLEVDPARDGRVQLHDAIARLDTKRESESEYGYILADEIQRLYGQSIGGEERPLSFWSWLKTSGTLLRHKLRIIAATTRRDSADPDSPRDMTEDVGFSMLQYTTSEFDTILAQFLELDVCKALKAVSADAAWSHVVNALREQCAGHAVAITLTMQKLNEYAQQKWVSMNPSDICMNLVSLILSRETALNFTRIWNRNILKPLSADDKDLADLRCEIQNAVMNDKKTVSWKTQASLARMFFIHPPAVESARRWEEIKPLFLTPLAYRRLFVDVFEGRSDGEFPASLEGLIRSALSSFSHVNLMNACDGGNFPKETSLQHMFWAGLAMALPPTTEVVPEAPAVLSQAGKRSGEIDFYVNTKLHWGIELMRLGDRLENHVKRFEKGGKYFTPNIQEFAIVDFVNHRYWPKKWPSGRIVVKFDYYYAFCTVYWGGPDKKETIRFK